MKIAVYPGSFDPITKGHIDVLDSGAKIFDTVIIAVAKNSEKNSKIWLFLINFLKFQIKKLKHKED